ncbi:hypothetical protein GC174_01300 [bacterium]|nr:hypothetical protein [bacterium]
MSIKTISRAVDLFLFAPTSPYPVAAFRILFGLLLLQHCLFIYPDLYNWYGAKSITLAETVDLNNIYVCLNLFNFFPGNDLWLTVIYSVYVLAALALTLGYRSRIASILIYLIFVSLYHRNPYLLNSGDTLVRVMSFWMIFAPTGAAWSLDHRRKVKKYGFEFSELTPSWGLRCLQLQFCCVYFHAVITKLPGWVWVNGTAVYIASRIEALMKFPLIPEPEHLLISQAISWMTLMIEAALFSLIWLRELRYYVLALGLCMHLTIDWCMNIPQFEWLMIASMVLFVYPVDLESALKRIRTCCGYKKPCAT